MEKTLADCWGRLLSTWLRFKEKQKTLWLEWAQISAMTTDSLPSGTIMMRVLYFRTKRLFPLTHTNRMLIRIIGQAKYEAFNIAFRRSCSKVSHGPFPFSGQENVPRSYTSVQCISASALKVKSFVFVWRTVFSFSFFHLEFCGPWQIISDWHFFLMLLNRLTVIKLYSILRFQYELSEALFISF